MATATKSYTFLAGTSASAAEANKNFDDILAFLNGGQVMHSDGTKAFTGWPLLPVGSPSNDRHPASKLYVDTKASNRLVASAAIPNGTVSVGASQGSAYTFSPTLSLVVSAADVSSQTKFIIEGEIGPCQFTSGGAFVAVVETTIDGTVFSSTQIPVDSAQASSLRFSARYVPTTAGTKTVRLRIWHNSGVLRGLSIVNGFGGVDGWWGITRTAP